MPAAILPGTLAGGWPYMTAVTYCLLVLLLARATYDLGRYKFDDYRGEATASDDAANPLLGKWRDRLLEVLSGAPSACRQRVLDMVADVEAGWQNTLGQYIALRGPGNWDPAVAKPAFPGRTLYMRLLSNPANTMRGWDLTVVRDTCVIMMEPRRVLRDDEDLQVSDLFISTCIMDNPATAGAGANCLGEDFQVRHLHADHRGDVRGRHPAGRRCPPLQGVPGGVSSVTEYCREAETLGEALMRKADTLKTRMVSAYAAAAGGARLSNNVIPSVYTATTSSAAVPAAAAADQDTLDLDALFATCTISPELQGVTGAAAI